MRKVLLVIMSAAFIISLSACGSSAPTVDERAVIIQEISQDTALDELQKLYLSLDRSMKHDDVLQAIKSTNLPFTENGNKVEITVGLTDESFNYFISPNDDIVKIKLFDSGSVDSITYYNYLKDTKLINGHKVLVEISGKSEKADSLKEQFSTLANAPQVKKPKNNKDSSKDNQESSVEPATLEGAIDEAIKTARAEKIKVEYFDNAVTETPDDKMVEVYLEGKDNLSSKMVRNGILIQANDILKTLNDRKDISQICIFWSMKLVDSYGNEKDWNVVKLLMKRETLDKIAWDKFDWNKLPDIADDYYEHSSLSK